MKAFISGKVSGEDFKQCSEKFLTAEYILRKKGFKEIYNPIKSVKVTPTLSKDDQWVEAMEQCIPEVLKADTVYFLADWQQSKGARIEHSIAKNNNKRMMYQEFVV